MRTVSRFSSLAAGLLAVVLPALLLVLLCTTSTPFANAALTDKATGISFAPKLTIESSSSGSSTTSEDTAAATTSSSSDNDNHDPIELGLFGVGVRKKGPIKVYSVGMYCSEALKEKLATMSRAASKGKDAALQTLRTGAKQYPTTFLLEMNFKVGAEKMANAIAESVSPRYTGNAADVDKLKGLIYQGVQSREGSVVKKGDKIQFDCSAEDGITVAVGSEVQGNVPSVGLASAFCDVYLDDNSVSPTLLQCCLDECCAP